MNLKNILLLNAVSSGATGLFVTFSSHLFANLFGITNQLPFIYVGSFLSVFALFVFIVAMAVPIRIRLVRVIIGLDITWVLASIITSILLFPLVTIWGILIVIGIAIWVALMAILQIKTSNH